jgi:catechol 2,3-dioxygenase-like lactoylglutathione lyase family enzyme
VRIQRILETAVYVGDLHRSWLFYEQLLETRPMLETERLVAFAIGGQSVLLLFQRGGSEAPVETVGGIVPGHGAQGVQHFAFAVSDRDMKPMLEKLANAGVDVESRVEWPRGGLSVYLRDPDGHSVELATPGIWEIY